jgi:hypothetical protein
MKHSPLLPMLSALLLPLALSGCATTRPQYVAASCPSLPPVPAPLMQPPPKPLQTASQIQSLLFVPVMPPTRANAPLVSK